MHLVDYENLVRLFLSHSVGIIQACNSYPRVRSKILSEARYFLPRCGARLEYEKHEERLQQGMKVNKMNFINHSEHSKHKQNQQK